MVLLRLLKKLQKVDTTVTLCTINWSASPDSDEAAPNNIQGKTDTYCTTPTLCLVIEHDSTLSERNTVCVISPPQRENADKEKIACFFETRCGVGSIRMVLVGVHSLQSQCQTLDQCTLDFIIFGQIIARASTSTTIQNRGHLVKNIEKQRT